MSNELQSLRKLGQIQRLYLTLLCFSASVLVTALAVVHNNSTRSSSIFIFLLFFGIGIMLVLGLVQGVLVSLLMISVWIAIKQLLGVWDEIRLLDNLLELILTSLTFILSGLYHDRLQVIMKVYRENQNKLKQLDLEDTTVGLIKPAIGLLRLAEEEDRSIRYRRPFALVLLMVQPIPEINLEPREMTELMRAVATGIKDTTRDTDIPFLAGNDKISIILPETETNGANKVLNNIFNRMSTTRFVTQSGASMFIQERVQLRFGFAVFLGISHTKIHMMEAAERSLQLCLETNIGDLFQNIFVEWVVVGEQSLSTPLFEKVGS